MQIYPHLHSLFPHHRCSCAPVVKSGRSIACSQSIASTASHGLCSCVCTCKVCSCCGKISCCVSCDSLHKQDCTFWLLLSVCVYALWRGCIFTCVYLCVSTHVHVSTHVGWWWWGVCVDACGGWCVCTGVTHNTDTHNCTHTQTCIYKYTHTHTHTQKHTHTWHMGTVVW